MAGRSPPTSKRARAHVDRLDADFARWKNERDRLFALMKEMKRRAAISDANAAKAKAAETRLRRFDEAGPPPAPPPEQAVTYAPHRWPHR